MLAFDVGNKMPQPPRETQVPARSIRPHAIKPFDSTSSSPQDPIVSPSNSELILSVPYHTTKLRFQMCFLQVECYLCFNQACGHVVHRSEGTVNVCEGQEVYHHTGDVTALEDCSVVANGAPDKISYHAGRADVLCNECSTIEARELHQRRRQLQYRIQNRLPSISTGWEEVPDWSMHVDAMVPWWMFNHGSSGGGG